MNYLNELIEITHRNAKRIGLAAVVAGAMLSLPLGVASYAHSRYLKNKDTAMIYGGLAGISLVTAGLGAFILREERYYLRDNSPRHQRV